MRFGPGVLAEAPELIETWGLGGYTLVTTERALAAAPAVAHGAAGIVHVPPGKVDEVSAGLLGDVDGGALVALGGGRVVDTAKAIAGSVGGRCAAIPTTLSGAEMTPFHRMPAGVKGGGLVRPALVVADPVLMASAPVTKLAASAMNALAHALEALYTPFANPVGDAAALQAAALLATGVTEDPPDADALALGAVLAGYASGAAGIAVHHAVCQTIVRTAGAPHAETNAVMLPHSASLMVSRAPAALGAFAEALGDPSGGPGAAPGRIAKLAARSGHTRLSTLGVGEEHVDAVAATAAGHPLMGNTPDPPGADELAGLVRGAL
ncbi:MAG TPA: iron-containing alcohol dehydrogenase [Thermoleophilaceae bacterium]|nr:iron-containing alcohol dehydrogenase [Thermoleophilaceae bacterium]